MIEDYLKDKHRPGMSFPSAGSAKERILYALSLIEKGSAADIAGTLAELERTQKVAALEESVETTLSSLCHDHLVECNLEEQVMIYHLPEKNKIIPRSEI